MADGRPGDTGGAAPDPAGEPDVYEGEGGGPAGPEGSGISDGDKAATSQMYSDLSVAGLKVGVAGAVIVARGQPLGGTVFVVAEAVAFASLVLHHQSDEPPRPHDRVVRFGRRKIVLPEPRDALEKRSNIAAQRLMFAGISGPGLLHAAERRDAAIAAGDVDWAITHDAVMRTAMAASRFELATAAVAMMRMADEVRAAGLDVAIETAHVTEVKRWLTGAPAATKLASA